MKQYTTFYELLEQQSSTKDMFLYEEEGDLCHITYEDFRKNILSFPKIEKQRVGILTENSYECILSIFACAYQKKDIILLNPRDDDETIKEQIIAADVAYLLGDVKNLYEEYLREDIPSSTPKILFFTSGTTSRAKAVVLDETKLCASAYNGGYCLPLKKEDILLCLLPLSHVFGFVCSLLWGLSFNCTIALGRGLRHMMDDLEFFKPTVLTAVPQMAMFYLKHELFNPELRLVLIGGGDCPENILLGIQNKGIQVSFGYGLTETSSGVALSTGKEPKKMTICPLNKITLAEDNEILIESDDILFDGYYKHEEDTKAVIIDHKYHTGDLGSIDEEGKLTIIGRKKEMLVFDDGTKIFLPEYEGRLKTYLPEDDLAVNIKDQQVCLYIHTKKEEAEINMAIMEFNKRCSRGNRISFVQYSSTPLPKTQTGKVKRYLLH